MTQVWCCCCHLLLFIFLFLLHTIFLPVKLSKEILSGSGEEWHGHGYPAGPTTLLLLILTGNFTPKYSFLICGVGTALLHSRDNCQDDCRNLQRLESLRATVLIDLSSLIISPRTTQVSVPLSKGRARWNEDSLCLKKTEVTWALLLIKGTDFSWWNI